MNIEQPTGSGTITSGATVISGGTTGSVLFVGAGSVIQQDNANFFWDDTNNRLGIGVAGAPSTTLHVKGGITIFSETGSAGVKGQLTMSDAGGVNFKYDGNGFAAASTTATVTGGGGSLVMGGVAAATFTIFNTTITQSAQTGTVVPALTLTGGAHTAQTASTEMIGCNFNFSATRQWNTGALATQREVVIQAPTYAFVGGSVISDAATLVITSGPIAGTNATITRSFPLWIQSGKVRIDGTLGFGLNSGNSTIDVVQVGVSGTPAAILTLAGGGHLVTASTEATDVSFSLGRTITWQTGALALQRTFVIAAPLIAFVGASTATTVATVFTSNYAASTNATITASWAIQIGADVAGGPTSTGQKYAGLNTKAHSVTLTGSTQVTTAGSFSQVRLDQLTITDASAVTIDAVSTIYIAGACVAAGSVTLTKNYSLWIDAGLPRIDSVTANSTTACLFTAASGPAAANTSIQEWLTIDINGTTRFIPCW